MLLLIVVRVHGFLLLLAEMLLLCKLKWNALKLLSVLQFWLTVHIPEQARAGAYQGAVRFRMGPGNREMPLTVTVHPSSAALSSARPTPALMSLAPLSLDSVRLRSCPLWPTDLSQPPLGSEDVMPPLVLTC